MVRSVVMIQDGLCCDEKDLKYYDLPTGWSWHIAPGELHRYGATNISLRMVEISSPQIDETLILDEEDQWQIKKMFE